MSALYATTPNSRLMHWFWARFVPCTAFEVLDGELRHSTIDLAQQQTCARR